MKAVIMSGGFGTRLMPLTMDIPKPVVPIMNRPVMEYMIELLSLNGIREIIVTLQHMPEKIISAIGDGSRFGVKIDYFIEKEPLGTAGCVKNVQKFLDDTFIVTSGDVLTDINISGLAKFHFKNKSKITMATVNVDNPYEYGIVSLLENGRIERFYEKPKPGEVFSNMVNTGIYVVEPDVLNLFNDGIKFDFSKNLFPIMLEKSIPLYGFQSKGYWCDIGTVKTYIKAHKDIFDGKVKVNIDKREVYPDTYIGRNVNIDNKARLKGPIYIGNNSIIREGSVIYPYTVIGNNNVINPNVEINSSVLWSGCSIGINSSIVNSVICSDMKLEHDLMLYDMALHPGSIS